MKEPSPWPEKDAALRELWAQGLSTQQIGNRLNVSKNAIIGRSRRIGLARRPSPLKGERKPQAARIQPVPALHERKAPAAIRGDTLATLAEPSRPVVVRPLAVVAPCFSKPIPRSLTCCWPIGEPRKPGFRFCDDASAEGRSYCRNHLKKAYLPHRTLAEKSEAQEAAHKAYVARLASMSHRSPRIQWQASEV